MLALAAEGLPTPRVVTKLDVAVQDAASADEVSNTTEHVDQIDCFRKVFHTLEKARALCNIRNERC